MIACRRARLGLQEAVIEDVDDDYADSNEEERQLRGARRSRVGCEGALTPGDEQRLFPCLLLRICASRLRSARVAGRRLGCRLEVGLRSRGLSYGERLRRRFRCDGRFTGSDHAHLFADPTTSREMGQCLSR